MVEEKKVIKSERKNLNIIFSALYYFLPLTQEQWEEEEVREGLKLCTGRKRKKTKRPDLLGGEGSETES